MNLQVIKDEDALYSLLLRGSNDHLEELLGAKNGEYKILKHTLKPKKNKKIISFSVYGENPIYLKGAETNIDEAEKVYPDWICRFYCTKDIKNLEALLKDKRCEVVVLDSPIWPMYWRFFVVDDPMVDVMISRDSDSIVGEKEKTAVEDWLQRKESFHTMHDMDADNAHAKIVMGGMWGLKTNTLKGITNLIDLYAKTLDYKWQYSQDQDFLEKYLFTLYKNDCIDHSSHKKIKWEHSIPFPDSKNNKYGGFVGDRVSPFQTGKINVYSHSKESNKIYLFCHQSQTDFKSCNALIRHLAEQYEEIIIPSRHANLVSKMIKDVPNIKVLPIVDDNQGMNFYIDIYKNEYKFIGVGLLSEDSSAFDISNPIESFYKQFNLNKQTLDEKYNL